MGGWQGFTVLEPVCIECGTHLAPWDGPADLDWRDDRERQLGCNALALEAHRHAEHRIQPAIGDLVQYAMPWRGHVLISDVYRVDGIHLDDDFHAFARDMRGDDLAPLLGTSYTLVNPHRSDDRCFPFFGDPERPLTFEIVTAAPPVQVDLMELLGWDFETQAVA